jgi:hypothetical protein
VQRLAQQRGLSVQFDFQIEGLDRVLQRAELTVRDIGRELAAATYEEAEAIMADSKENYVPIDLGTLKNSGYVEPPQIEGDTIVVRMGYGGAAKAYALAVHEHLSEHSPPSWKKAGGAGVTFSPSDHGPKYLERPLLAAVSKVRAALLKAARKALR